MKNEVINSRTPYVSISDLIERLEAIGTEYSIAIDQHGQELLVVDPNTFRIIGHIALTESGAWIRE